MKNQIAELKELVVYKNHMAEKDKKSSLVVELTKYDYPLYFRCRNSSLVVKFIGLTEGTSEIQGIGTKQGIYCPDLTPHTDLDVWEPLPVCKNTGFFHGQLVECWKKWWTHCKQIKHYNAIDGSVFGVDGSSIGTKYDNMVPIERPYTQFELNAFLTIINSK